MVHIPDQPGEVICWKHPTDWRLEKVYLFHVDLSGLTPVDSYNPYFEFFDKPTYHSFFGMCRMSYALNIY